MAFSAGISLGPMLLGFVLDTILYGAVVTQSLVYFSCYKSDGRWLKFFVASLFVLDTFNVVLELTYVYSTLIVHFGDPNVLLETNWIFSTIPGTTGITSAMVQLFFAWRIGVLKQNRPLIASIIFLALVGMLCGIGTSIAINFVPTFAQFQKLESIMIVWLSASAADNLLITTSLVLFLREYRTGFADTDHVIKKIIRLTLHPGMLTTIWTIVDLWMYLALHYGAHLVFMLPLAKFYTNSLLSTLISRTRGSNNFEFSAVDGSPHIERQVSRTFLSGSSCIRVVDNKLTKNDIQRESLVIFNSRNEVHTRNTEIIFEAVSAKKIQDQMSAQRDNDSPLSSSLATTST